ncbi:MAG: alpha/beta hydrolase [Microthrixaceae bacterium]
MTSPEINTYEPHKEPSEEIWSSSPGWFRRALEIPMGHGAVEVDGASIHFLTWGEVGRPGLVFVHGGGANAYWWAHIAAQFADDFRVLAVDMSGHGDSGHRQKYSLVQWTQEVMAAAAAGGIEGPPVVIGHSMGGFVAIVTAALHSPDLAGVIVCDSPVTEPDPEVSGFHIGDAFGRPRVYESLDVVAGRFRTVPMQEHYLDFVMDHVARNSAKEYEGGWAWKFDRNIFGQFAGSVRGVALPYLSDVTCRLALLRSENGLVTKDIGESMFEKLGRVTPVIEIPEAGHHAMLDEPLILLTAIRSLIADWQHSEPHRRS